MMRATKLRIGAQALFLGLAALIGWVATPPKTAAAPSPPEDPARKTVREQVLNSLREQAHDPKAVKAALDDAAGMGRTLWIAFISLSAYLAITVGAVTHRKLFDETPVQLPLLNVELPLVNFFWIAPILFLIVHLYLLIHLKLLADNVLRYEPFLAKAGKDEEELRYQLPNFVLVQMLAAPTANRGGLMGWMLQLMIWLTVALGPLVLLLLIQVQFLPFHHHIVTWVQRGAIVADLLMLTYFWPKIIHSAASHRAQVGKSWSTAWQVAEGLAALAFIYISVAVATFPGETHDNNVLAHLPIPWADEELIEHSVGDRFPTLYEWLFQGAVNELTGQRRSIVSNTLVLPSLDLVDEQKLHDIQEAERNLQVPFDPYTAKRTISLRGRDLRGAVFLKADLRRADLTGVQLQGAKLLHADLREALMSCATTGKASSKQVGTDVGDATQCDADGTAHLQGAVLSFAQLQGAWLDGAELRGAQLDDAQLQGASLSSAKLQFASLAFAQLQGASLVNSQLQGANLFNAGLQGANLSEAQLQGADLDYAKLQGAYMLRAQLQGASLRRNQFEGAFLSQIAVWRATLETPRGVQEAEISMAKKPFCPRGGRLGWCYQSWFDRVQSIAFQGVPETRPRISYGLWVLGWNQLTPQEDIDLQLRWQEAKHRAATRSVFRRAFARELANVVCGTTGAPHIAQQITASVQFIDAGLAALPLLRRMVEPDKRDCRGAQGLSEFYVTRLHRILYNLEKRQTEIELKRATMHREAIAW